MQAEKTLPNARVKSRVLLEPLVRLGLVEPKLQDVRNPPIFKIIGDCGTLPDLRIISMDPDLKSSVRRLGREDVEYRILDEPEISSPIIMNWRINDRSPLLAHILKLIDEFDQWTKTDVSAPRRKGEMRQS